MGPSTECLVRRREKAKEKQGKAHWGARRKSQGESPGILLSPTIKPLTGSKQASPVQERAGKVRAEQWRSNSVTVMVIVTPETQTDLKRRGVCIAPASTVASIGMNHYEGEDNKSSAMVGQQLVDEDKSPIDPKPTLKRKTSSFKKIYIRNYFTRARSGAGEGDEEGDSIIPLANPTPQAPHAPATLLSPIQEFDSVPRSA
ncbi:hypothetical protein NDU88_001827 [Pleurodeles waltl]|uniref:Uncharacterized protein n=1 Tax=Pleurodeles waltl TaxID=8319 RepID=A0AAV7MKW2_PLEWA|nr:hypothetical protein NDU88_001827 [Pleurodeles waltl]